MTLPTTGAIHLAQIGQEAKKPLLSAVDMNDAELRKLPNKITPASQISFADFYGTGYGVGPGYGASTFTNLPSVYPGIEITSNTITIYDASTDPTSFAVTSGVGFYRINGGAWVPQTTLGSIKNGDTLALKQTSSATYLTESILTVSYNGGVTKAWSITSAGLGATVYNRLYYRTDSQMNITGGGISPTISGTYLGIVGPLTDSPSSSVSITRNTANGPGTFYMNVGLRLLTCDSYSGFSSVSATFSTSNSQAISSNFITSQGVGYGILVSHYTITSVRAIIWPPFT